MNSSPLISVVIPCFNDGKYLPETIQRLRKQPVQDFEIIVVNDGSTDEETLRVLAELSDDGVTVLTKENGRMSSARNFGVREAKGKYIAALDADDYFDKSFFQKAIDILQDSPEVAVVTSYIQLFGVSSAVSKPRGGGEKNFLFSSECPACAMVRKDVWNQVGGYDELMVHGYEDWEFYIRVTQNGYVVHVIPEKLLFYRQTQKSTHKNYTLKNRQSIISYIVEKHKDWYLNKIKEMTNEKTVLYTKNRISFQNIFMMFKRRLTGRYE